MVHMNVNALIDAVNIARAAFRAVGEEHWLFSIKFTIGTLVGKLKKETQARWYLFAPRFPGGQEETMFKE